MKRKVLKYLNRFLLAIPKNYENLFDQSSFSDNTQTLARNGSTRTGSFRG